MAAKVLVAGASGVLGRAVVDRLKQQGHFVRALSRRGRAAAGGTTPDETVQADALVMDSLARVMDGMDWVFSCVGASVDLEAPGRASFHAVDVVANSNLLERARHAGVKRFAYVSVHCDGMPPTRYVDAHLQVEARIAASGLQPVILRPTGFFSALESLLRLGLKGKVPAMGAGAARSNPIHDVDLAQVCVDALEAGTALTNVGGPQVLSRAEISRLAAEAAGSRVRTVPGWVPTVMAPLARPFHPRVADLMEFFSQVMRQDLVAPAFGSRLLGDYFHQRAAQLKGSSG